MNEEKNFKALCYLPAEQKIYSYSPSAIEAFTSIDDYWMKREGLLMYPFNRNGKAYFFSKDKVVKEAEEFDLVSNPQMTAEEYMTSVYLAQSSMEEGEIDKVVLARNQLMDKTTNAQQAFKNAVAHFRESYCYYVDLGEEQWVGASPELLIHYEEGTMYTVALAGTKPIDAGFNKKEHEEHDMVEQFVEEKLNQLGISNYTKSEKHESQFDTLKHLKTAYSAQVEKSKALELLKHLQPTSAVCGLPRDKSFGFIQDYETLDRSFYSGLVGVFSKDRVTCFVNLRCIRFRENQAELFAGAGITKDSDPKAEWEETEAKIKAIQEMMHS